MVADDDIVCYKVLRLNRENNHFYTPFRNTLVPYAVLEGKRDFVADGIVEFSASHGFFTVRMGAIHVYTEREVAMKHIGPDETVRKCVIPKGTEFVFGYDDFNCCGFAAKKIKFIKE
jgi:hypothetical protein